MTQRTWKKDFHNLLVLQPIQKLHVHQFLSGETEVMSTSKCNNLSHL